MRVLVPMILCFSFAKLALAQSTTEIRFCPADQARSYPLDDRGRVQSILLPHIALINHAAKPFNVKAIHLELLREGEVVDTRTLGIADIQRIADNGSGVQDEIGMIPFEYCGTDLIGPGIKLAGPLLRKNESLLVKGQVLAFNGERDMLRVRAEGSSADQLVEISATVPIRSEIPAKSYLFPLRGVSYVGWGPSFHTGHRWTWPEEFALDIARLGGKGLTYHGSGTKFSDYYAYGSDVLAAAAGRVIETANNEPENPALLQRRGESGVAYAARQKRSQTALLNSGGILGNYVTIDQGDGEYALYAHLLPGSVRVHVGDRVTPGDVLGKLGGSGNSTEPHLHFQVCAGPSPSKCAGVPLQFSNIDVLWAEFSRPLQSGDIVTVK